MLKTATNKSAKKSIALYYILSLSLLLPLLIPLWLIKGSLWVIVYLLCFLIYTRIAISFAVRLTVMSSLWKELDAEKYAAIINAKSFRVHYSYRLNLYFSTGDYQAAYNVISSALLPHKNTLQRIYGYLLLCRICFERGDYEGIKENLAEIEHYLKYNPSLRLPKQNKEAYEFYREFADADYASVLAILEKGIDRYSKKKGYAYIVLMRQYQLAVTKRMMGDVDEAISLLESIREKAPKLVFSTLAQKQLDYISGTLEETTPEKLEVTEIERVKSRRKAKIILIVVLCIGFLLIIVGTILGQLTAPKQKIIGQLDAPKQENKDSEYIAHLEGAIEDDYEEYQILGYFYIYTDYADETYMMSIDSLFLVESNGSLDLHTLYVLNGEYGNILNVKDIQVNQLYEYEIYFTPKKVEFVLTEKKRDIPEDMLYYYEIDGYYFCVMSISDME
ncbi:MAG: hypothetical protein E7629_02235 [Ruminococcaceae bacterium]|nr:hypothetical protein [Oscillospiraceae bacterium]